MHISVLAQELEAYTRMTMTQVEKGHFDQVQILAAHVGKIALQVMEEAEALNREAARDAFPDGDDQ
jgi:hypothetical protein